MANEPFIGEIMIFAGNFAPRGWAFCDGTLIPISTNTALFALLGTTYGGNGTTTFALPDLRGCSPLGAGQGPGLSQRDLGEEGGAENVTLLAANLPAHTHAVRAVTGAGDRTSPQGATWAKESTGLTAPYASGSPVAMAADEVMPAGASLPHNNMPPYLTLNFVIATQGIFPSRP